MKRFRFESSGSKHDLEKSLEDAKIEERPGGWLLIHLNDGSRKRVMASMTGENAGFSLDGRLIRGRLVTLSGDHGSATAQGSESDLQAQFPGKVVKVLVKPGDAVEPGAILLVMEAMKMEFSIKAPFKGTIKTIHVSVGTQVNQGAQFVEIDRDL